MPKIEFVSQAELGAVLASYNALGQTILEIRRRLESGAAVEEGIYTADSNRGDPISGFERAMKGIGMFGLDLETKGLPSDVYVEHEPEQPEASEPEIPEWLAETPWDVAYRLAMRDSGNDGEYCQVIELTRKEFLMLKVYIARLRGIPIPQEMPKDYEHSRGGGDPFWTELEPEEIAAVPEAAHAGN